MNTFGNNDLVLWYSKLKPVIESMSPECATSGEMASGLLSQLR